jgi:hypothetical protein
MRLGGIVQHGKGRAVCARICDRSLIGRPPSESAKEYAFTHALRRPTANEKGPIARLDWLGDRHPRSSKMRYEIRFGPDICNAPRAVMREAKHVTLVGGCNDQINVVETAIEHSATERKGKRVLFGYKTRNLLRPTRRV